MPLEIRLAVWPFLVACALSAFVAPGIISILKRRKVGQTIQEGGPETHQNKAGTPTMGGLIILVGTLIGAWFGWISIAVFARSLSHKPQASADFHAILKFGFADASYLIAIVLLVLSYSLLGAIDDYLTVNPRRGVRGIASKPKAALQVLLAAGFLMWLRSTGFDPVLRLAGFDLLAGWPYWGFALAFIVGMANFINITDGLDGLVSGLTVIAALGLLIASQMTGLGRAGYCFLVLLPALSGACLVFLWHNKYPAKVFMGDTGSLAIGAALPAIAIMAHREVLLIVVGLVFILDGFSTIIQWAVFKFTRITTGTGRRVFLKSPIHHHFEMTGLAEQTVVVRFWICGVMAAALGYAGALLRWW